MSLPLRPLVGRPLGLLLLLAPVALGACDLGALGQPSASLLPEGQQAEGSTFHIPPPRPPRRARTNEDALAVYPLLDSVGRDPFLTQAEEESLTTGTPVEEHIVVTPPPSVKKGAPPAAPRMAGLENLPNEVATILIGQGGRRMFVYRGGTFEEGQQVGDYVIASITEDAVSFRERTTQATRTLRFKRDAASDWQKH